VLLLVLAAAAWIPQGPSGPVLVFSRADVQFLFPAPFTRKQLIRYRVLRSQIGSLIGSAIVTLILRPGSVISSWTFLAGIAILMSIVKLHLTGAMLTRGNLSEHGWFGLKRQWLVPALFGGAIVVLATAVYGDWTKIISLGGPGEILAELRSLLSTGMPSAVLWPFRAVVRLPLSATPGDFWKALPWALGILALNYQWVLRSDAAFEEASAEFAEKLARIRTKGLQPRARKAQSTATPFHLAVEGRPEMAVFWKNLIMVGRYVSLKTLLRLAPLIVFLGTFFAAGRHGSGGVQVISVMSAVLAGMIAFMGPMIARNDLRSDLANLAMLKTWPISGAELVRGEVLAPAAILTALEWLCGIAILMFSNRFLQIFPFVVAGAMIAPGLLLMQLIVQNGIAVMYPSWAAIRRGRAQGIDVMGQRMLMMAGMMIVLVAVLLPAAILGSIAGVIGYLITKTIPVLIPGAIVGAALLVESYLVSEAVGKLLDRTDISAIDAAEQ
jgi:hypothetical protein